MPYAEINGTKIFYEVFGTGIPVIFIHGVAITSKVWDFQKEAVSRELRMIVYDLRGSGKSGKTPEVYHTADLMSQDLRALIDYLGLDRVHLVGVSLGAAVAMKFAINYPEKVNSLFITGAFHDLFGILNVIRKYFAWLVGRLLMTRFFGELAAKIMLPSASRNELLYYHRNIISVDTDEIRKYNQILASYQITSALSRIHSSTLILYGAYESVLHKYGILIQKQIKNSRMEIIPGVGHGWNGEKPDLFSQRVIEFVKKAETESTSP